MSERSTNQQIATLILEQTYEERVALASYLAMAASSLAEEGRPASDLDTLYFASLLADWAGDEEVEE